ncbi:MAG: succinylglutamate desuccinylase/aspartoacylase family protein, partial [bacterium]
MLVIRPRRPRLFDLVGLTLCLALAAPLHAAPTPRPTSGDWGPLRILGHEVDPGQREKLGFQIMPSFVDSFVDTPVVALRGQTPGLTLCVTGGIHGDEINGVEIARRVLAAVDPHQLAGSLIVVPVINAAGF